VEKRAECELFSSPTGSTRVGNVGDIFRRRNAEDRCNRGCDLSRSGGTSAPFYFRAVSPRRALVYSRGTDKARDPSALYRAVTIFIVRRFTSAISRARVCPRRVNTSPNQFSRDRNISQLRPGAAAADRHKLGETGVCAFGHFPGYIVASAALTDFFPKEEPPVSRGGSVPSVAVLRLFLCDTSGHLPARGAHAPLVRNVRVLGRPHAHAEMRARGPIVAAASAQTLAALVPRHGTSSVKWSRKGLLRAVVRVDGGLCTF